MSKKFVLIGAGSHVFTRNLVRDILTYPAFADATIALVDINPEGLEYARREVQHIIDAGHYPAKLICTTDRKEVLPGADGVLSMLMAQPLEVFRNDLEICEKYGVKINVGDTRNPAGIFRFLRTVPVMLDILKDIERYRRRRSQLVRSSKTGWYHKIQGSLSHYAADNCSDYFDALYSFARFHHERRF